MFTTIRKHQKWLWGFIIAAVIVSFVIYFNPSGRLGSGGARRASFGSIHGRPIARREYVEAQVESQLAFLMRYNRWPGPGEARQARFSLERETRNRLVLLDCIRELNIKPGEPAVAEWIVATFGVGSQPGSAKARYGNFVRELQNRYRVTEASFQNYIEHEIAITHLAALAGLPGRLITPRAAVDVYREGQEKIEAEAVLFSGPDYAASVKMDPAATAEFYTNRQGVYRIPERVQVEYVPFALTNYYTQADQELAKNTNLATDIERAYLASNKSMFTDTNGQALPPDAAKAKIRDQVRERQALVEAHKAAAKFATELDGMKPMVAANLEKLATAKGMTTATTEPFSELDGPKGMKVQENFVKSAFLLTPQDPVAITPIRAEDAIYILALKQRLPSEIPPLESIRAKVEADFRQDQANRLAREAGTNFVTRLTNGLAQGKTFGAVCAETKVTPIELPAFSPASRPTAEWDRRLDLNQVKVATAGLGPGKASYLVLTREGGLVVFVKSRTPVADAELKQELPGFLANLRQAEQYDAFNDWFRRQLEVSRIETYLGKEESEPAGRE